MLVILKVAVRGRQFRSDRVVKEAAHARLVSHFFFSPVRAYANLQAVRIECIENKGNYMGKSCVITVLNRGVLIQNITDNL